LRFHAPREFEDTARFQVLRRLGSGGMGVVYAALDRERGVEVALKTLRLTGPESVLRLKNEFRSLLDIEHPNLVGLGELFFEAEQWFFTMDLIEGRDFLEYVEKGVGTRSSGQHSPAETIWVDACTALAAWGTGSPIDEIDVSVAGVTASRLLAPLGERTPLKQWQVQRVIDKIRSVIHWQGASDDPSLQYSWLLLSGGEYESAYRDKCPGQYREHEDYWLQTVRTIIHDTENGDRADLSLGLAIDMLWPCHWRVVDNLRIVLEANGGKLEPEEPFAACGRNIGTLPTRRRMETVSATLRAFCGAEEPDEGADSALLTLLGEPTDVKRWLAASLDKTIRLQLEPPANVRAQSAMSGPALADELGLVLADDGLGQGVAVAVAFQWSCGVSNPTTRRWLEATTIRIRPPFHSNLSARTWSASGVRDPLSTLTVAETTEPRTPLRGVRSSFGGAVGSRTPDL
jgi:hypothetical protein